MNESEPSPEQLQALTALAEAADEANPGWRDLDLRVYFEMDGWPPAWCDWFAAAVNALPSLIAEVEALRAALSVERIAEALHESLCMDPLCRLIPWAELASYSAVARDVLDRERHLRHATALRAALLAPTDTKEPKS